MATTESSAPAHPPTGDHGRPHVCYSGVVYIGHLVEEDGEEVEVFEAVPCRRCADSPTPIAYAATISEGAIIVPD